MNLYSFIENLKKFVRERKGYVLHIDPNILYKSRDINGDITDEYDNGDIVEILKKQGFIHNGFTTGYDQGHQVRWQYVIDLEGKSFDDIVKEFNTSILNLEIIFFSLQLYLI